MPTEASVYLGRGPLYEMRDESTSEHPLVKPRQIEKHFGAVIARAGISVAVHAGEFH